MLARRRYSPENASGHLSLRDRFLLSTRDRYFLERRAMSAEPIFLNSTAYTDYERRLQKLTETALFSRNLLNAKQQGQDGQSLLWESLLKNVA
jgi:hypothetical protein